MGPGLTPGRLTKLGIATRDSSRQGPGLCKSIGAMAELGRCRRQDGAAIEVRGLTKSYGGVRLVSTWGCHIRPAAGNATTGQFFSNSTDSLCQIRAKQTAASANQRIFPGERPRPASVRASVARAVYPVTTAAIAAPALAQVWHETACAGLRRALPSSAIDPRWPAQISTACGGLRPVAGMGWDC